MNFDYVNRSGLPVPRRFLQTWVQRMTFELQKRKVLSKQEAELTLFVAFVDPKEIRSVNKSFRGKNRPTDVLSFSSDDPELIGELMICPQVIRTQASEHGLSQRDEMAYMLTHGLLHLLGFEHEQGGRPAEIMYKLQDSLFEKLHENLDAKPR